MKKLIAMTLATALAVTAGAVPAKRGTQTVTQSDGTTITVTAAGDEWHHSVLTTDGLTVARADDGNFYYRDANGITAVRAHDAAGRDAAEQQFVATNRDKLTMTAIETSASESRRARAAVARRAGQTPTMGTNRIPVILVQYNDEVKFKSNHGLDVFKKQYETGEASARQYFLDQSKNLYDPHFDVYGPVTLTKSRATYGGNDSYGYDKGVGTMVGEACVAMKDRIDWTLYDGDGDGECDVVIVVYAGVGEAQAYGIVPDSVWPCQWDLTSSDYGKSLTYNGITIDKFAVFNELNGSSDSSSVLDGIGTVCHEFSHCLGLPDFYDTRNTNNPNFGMDSWSLMDYGCYNNDGNTPIGYSAYEKNFMGWLDYVTPKENTRYTLPYTNNVNDASEVAIKMTNTKDTNEYYVLETRKRQGWDAYIKDDGLLVTHVTFAQTYWDNNTVNNTASKQRMTIIPADNTLSHSSLSGDLFGTDNHELTDRSTPAAKVFTGSYMGQPLTEINYADGTTTLWYMKADEPPLETYPPVPGEAIGITANSFTAQWTDETPAENIKSYTLRVGKYDPDAVTLLLSESFPTTKFNGAANNDISSSLDMYMENAGWTGSTLYKDSGGIRVGKSAGTGYLTSPALTLPAGVTTVTAVFTAKCYNTDTNVPITVSVGNNTENFTVTDGTEQTFTASLACTSGGKVKFANTANRSRMIITDLKLYAGTVADNAPRRASETGDESSRMITDITDTQYTVEGLTADTEYAYAVKAIYADDSESEWVEGSHVTTLQDEVTPNPAISANPTTLEFGEVTAGATVDPLSVEVTGTDLTTEITVLADDGLVIEGAEVTPAGTFLPPTGGTLSVTIDTEALSLGDYAGNITLMHDGIDNTVIPVTATIVPAPIEHNVPDIIESSDDDITATTFTARWTAVDNVVSYNLHATSHIESDSEATTSGARKRVNKIDDEVIDITGITDDHYTLEGLAPGRTYTYQVQAVYTDGVTGDWSEPAEFTTTEQDPTEYHQYDVNRDTKVNVADVNVILDYILTQEGFNAPRHEEE